MSTGIGVPSTINHPLSTVAVGFLYAPTVVAGAAGNVEVGWHAWRYVFVRDDASVSVPSTLTPLEVVAAAKKVNLSLIIPAPPGTSSVQFYRTLTAASQALAEADTVYKLVGEVLAPAGYPTMVALEDNVADANLGAAIPNLLSVAEDGAGNVDVGTHKWSYTWLKTNGEESAESPYTFWTIAASAKKIQLANVRPGPPGTTSRRVYRTAAGGGAAKLVGTIGNNTTTTFEDNVADVGLGVDGPTNNVSTFRFTVIQAVDLLAWDKKCFTVRSVDFQEQGFPFVGVRAGILDASPLTPALAQESDYEVIDAATFASLSRTTSAQVKNDSRRTWRLRIASVYYTEIQTHVSAAT